MSTPLSSVATTPSPVAPDPQSSARRRPPDPTEAHSVLRTGGRPGAQRKRAGFRVSPKVYLDQAIVVDAMHTRPTFQSSDLVASQLGCDSAPDPEQPFRLKIQPDVAGSSLRRRSTEDK